MVTVASGITAPVGSATVPRREVVACECATEMEITDAKRNTAMDLRQRALLITPPEKQESSLRAHFALRGLPRFFFKFPIAGANNRAPSTWSVLRTQVRVAYFPSQTDRYLSCSESQRQCLNQNNRCCRYARRICVVIMRE